jgi:dihydroorotase
MTRIILRGGRILSFCDTRVEGSDVAISAGKIDSVGHVAEQAGDRVIDVAGAIITPALTDIHTHIYWGGTSLGARPETVAHRSATGVFVDAGSAGAGNYEGLRAFIAEPSPFHIFAYLNISYAGIFGFGKDVMVGECCDARLLDTKSCLAAVRSHRDRIVGVKVRAGHMAAGENGALALDLALEVAEELGVPIMCHVDLAPPTIDEVCDRLRPGDIITHCCRPAPNSATQDGHVREAAWKARRRGVRFDVGHGRGGFSFKVCREMLDEGFAPDLISSDIHALSVDGPAHDLLTTVNKLIALGVAPDEALAAASRNPAEAIGRPDLGRILAGDEANIAVMRWKSGPWQLQDAAGEIITVEKRLICEHLIVRGRAITATGEARPLHELAS